MEILYELQKLRLSCPDWINTFFILFSSTILILAPLIAAITYWCADRKKGTYIMCAFTFALLLNEVLKVTFCVYRPWVLDPRIIPAATAISTSTGYSFPSSHCSAAAVIMTSFSFAFPQNRKLHLFSLVFIILQMFSRMYLGCHSLIDVCFGALLGAGGAFIFRPMLKEEFDEERFTRLLVPVCCTLSIVTIVYVTLKSYPLDVQSDGTLLVNPADMQPDVIRNCGMTAGLGISLFLERTRVHFEMPDTGKKAFLRALLGSALFGLLYAVALKKLFGSLDPCVFRFLQYFFCTLFIGAGYPWMCKRFRL